MEKKLGFIIQARSGSTRLPNKVLIPLNEGKGILEIIIGNLKQHFPNIKIIVATTTQLLDDPIIELAKKMRVEYFRGDENNVLMRMHEAASNFGINYIVRVCADNPILNMRLIENLLHLSKNLNKDYISYKTLDGTPVIKSHLGLFTEIVSANALKKSLESTNDPKYLEHVTNYIYEHENVFNIELIPLPQILRNLNKFRFTIDNIEDFETCKLIMEELRGKEQNLNSLISFVSKNKINISMYEQIKKYQK